MQIRKIIAALAMTTALALPAEAMSEMDIIDEGYYGDHELDTLMPEILKFGYQEIHFKSYGDAVEGAKNDLICPDYEARTGKKADCNSLIEIAAMPLTGGTNDIIAISHLEGDCSEHGCKAFVYKNMAGGIWVKMLSFTNTGGMAYKHTPQGMLFTSVGLEGEKAAVKTWIYKDNGFSELE